MKIEKKLINNWQLGTDAELFLFSEEKNKFIPVCGLVGGTKDEPLPITDKGHGLQEDNCLLELTIPPCKTSEEFMDHIGFVKNYIKDSVLKPLGLIPIYQSVAEFDESDLTSPQSKHLGCNPDYNAWTHLENIVELPNPLKRCSGMHVHCGYDNPDAGTSIKLIRAMDLFLGVPSVLLDEDTERRTMYGKAGAYRFKRYGVEARILSGFFLSSDELIKWVFDSTIKAIDFVNIGGEVTNPDHIIKCINTSDRELAKEIMEDYRIVIENYETIIK